MDKETQENNKNETYFTIMTKSGLPIRLSSTQLKILTEKNSQDAQENM